MPHSWTEERGDDPTGDRIPAFLWTRCLGSQRQSASVRRDDRELPEHRVTIHPVKGLPDRGDAKKALLRATCPRPWTAATGCLSTPGCRRDVGLRDHVCIWIGRNNLGDGVG